VDVSVVPGIAGAFLFRPTPHADQRGFFSRTFDAEAARAVGIDPGGFSQDSISRNLETFELRDTEQVSLYIPAGCAHGFQALTDPADVAYRIDRPHDPSEDVAIAFDDPDLAIPWPLPPAMMSDRDRAAPSLEVALKQLA
jgi:dTDP-4-dehydrorhamnose 3,5-epimerase